MKQSLAAMVELVPDFMDVLSRRYRILQTIDLMAPVGRRTLANVLMTSERKLRTETDFLREHEFITSTRGGMILTPKGSNLLEQLMKVMHQFAGTSRREQQLAEYFNIEKVVIVPGDLSTNNLGFTTFGYILSEWLAEVINTGPIENVTVLGGSTLAGVAGHMRKIEGYQDITFVSGRGGLGENLEHQANNVTATMAKRIGGKHVSLHVPEQLTKTTYENLLTEPSITRVLELIKKSSIAIHGIGGAMAMAKEREMSNDEISMLKNKKAVAEVFGTFYNQEGDIIYQIPRIGLQSSSLAHIPHVYAVAGGHKKASAICAYLTNAPSRTWLLTDEGAADLVLKGLSL